LASAGYRCIYRNAHQQRLDLVEPLGCHHPKFGGMTTDHVAQRRAPIDQLVTYPAQHQRSLLFGRLHRHKPHPRPAHGFANRLRIGRIILVARHVRLHPLRRQKHGLVPQRCELTRPVLRSATGFNPDPHRWQLCKELKHLPPPQLLAQNRSFGRIHPMQLKNTLGRVHTNADKIVHGRLPCLRSPTDLILAHRCRRGPSTPTCFS